MRHTLLATTALLCAWTTPAWADNQPATQNQASPATGIQDIVVTAQRRVESSQKAGIAIDVVSGAALVQKGLTQPVELSQAVPALNVGQGGGPLTSFFLRGVGNFTSNGYTDPAVAFSYDGVYMGRVTETSGLYYDLERVEVLKGPQGTLYGRNATAGAINVIPAKPRPGEWSGDANAYVGNYGAYGVEGAVNAPVGEHGALRIAGNVVSHDGYLSDGTGDEKSQALRAQLLAELSSNLTIRIGADWSHGGGLGPGSSYAGSYAYNRTSGSYIFTPSGLGTTIGMLDPAAQAYRQTLFLGPSGRRAGPLDADIGQDNTYYGTNAEVTWKTGIGTVTVLPAWRYANIDSRFLNPGFFGWEREKDDQFSLETRLATKRFSIFDAIAGAYLFDETVDGHYTFAQQALNAYSAFTSKTRSYAGYARLTAHVSDRFRLVGGLRFTQDDKRFDGQADNLIEHCTVAVSGRPSCPTVPLLPVTATYSALTSPFVIASAGGAAPIGTSGAVLVHQVTPVHAPLDTGKATWRAAVEYDLGPRSLAYASVETGYRSGGFSLAAGYQTYQPEYITAYTIGTKNRFLNNRLQLNLEAFYWKYTNQQVNHFGVDINGNTANFTQNVGDSTIKGAEADIEIKPTRSTLLSTDIQYLDSKYTYFSYATAVGTAPPLTGCAYGGNPANSSQYIVNCSGKPGYQSPRWTINMSVEQTIPLGDYKLVATLDTQYKTSRYIAFEFLPQELVGPTWTSDAELRFAPRSGRWSLAAYVRNMENDRIPITAPLYAVASSLDYITTAPRTWGLRAGVKF